MTFQIRKIDAKIALFMLIAWPDYYYSSILLLCPWVFLDILLERHCFKGMNQKKLFEFAKKEARRYFFPILYKNVFACSKTKKEHLG